MAASGGERTAASPPTTVPTASFPATQRWLAQISGTPGVVVEPIPYSKRLRIYGARADRLAPHVRVTIDVYDNSAIFNPVHIRSFPQFRRDEIVQIVVNLVALALLAVGVTLGAPALVSSLRWNTPPPPDSESSVVYMTIMVMAASVLCSMIWGGRAVDWLLGRQRAQ